MHTNDPTNIRILQISLISLFVILSSMFTASAAYSMGKPKNKAELPSNPVGPGKYDVPQEQSPSFRYHSD